MTNDMSVVLRMSSRGYSPRAMTARTVDTAATRSSRHVSPGREAALRRRLASARDQLDAPRGYVAGQTNLPSRHSSDLAARPNAVTSVSKAEKSKTGIRPVTANSVNWGSVGPPGSTKGSAKGTTSARHPASPKATAAKKRGLNSSGTSGGPNAAKANKRAKREVPGRRENAQRDYSEELSPRSPLTGEFGDVPSPADHPFREASQSGEKDMLPMALPVEPPAAEATGAEIHRRATAEDLRRQKDKQAREAAALRVRKEDRGDTRSYHRKGSDEKKAMKLEPEEERDEERDDLAWARKK